MTIVNQDPTFDKPLDNALRLAALGWKIFPVHHPLFDDPNGDLCSCEAYRHSHHCVVDDAKRRVKLHLPVGQHCKHAGKHPRGVKNWKADASNEPDVVRAWLKKFPQANYGIHIGGSGLIVLDFDTTKPDFDGAELLAELQASHPTTTVLTGSGGFHLVYQMPTGLMLGNEIGDLPAGVDVRGAGGYIVGAGSLHRSGRRYSWIVPPWQLAPAPLPDLILALIQTPKAQPQNNTVGGGGGAPSLDDATLLAKARAAGGGVGAAFSRLFDDGDLSAYGGDHSSADLALMSKIGYWTGADEQRILSIFKQSRLYDPVTRTQKHRDYDAYLLRTVRKAIAALRKVYTPVAAADPAAVAAAQAAVGVAQADADPADAQNTTQRGAAHLVTVSGDLGAMRDKALQVLIDGNAPEPSLFVAGGALVEIVRNGALPKIRDVTRPALLNRLVDLAKWEDGKGRPTAPPKDAADLILALPDLPFPHLTGIAHAPLFGADGCLYVKPGFIPDAKVIVDHDLAIPDVEATPEAVAAARRLWVDELLADFPFVDDASRAHAVALGLLPFVRHMIDGATPLHLIEASLRGSGKGLLAAAVSLPALGRAPESRTLSNDENERRKAIFSALLEGQSHIIFDNVTLLDSDSLALALTQDSFSDRVLGSNTTRSAPVRCVWAATGNNLTVSEDIGRRCCFIRLEPKVEDPELRSGFRHTDLLAWVSDHRADFVWAALVLVQNWIDQGRPKAGAIKGSFQRWADVIGGILATAGIPGFLANERTTLDAKTPEREAWRLFVAAWWDAFGDKPVTVGDLCRLALPESLNPGLPGLAGIVPASTAWLGLLEDVLNCRDLATAKKTLGMSLSQWNGRVVTLRTANNTVSVALRRGDKGRTGVPWQLVTV